MPAADVALPLVQLYGDLDSAMPYDMAYNATHGADLAGIYHGLPARLAGGIDADTRYGALATEAVLGWMKAHYAAGIGPWKEDLLQRAPIGARADADDDDRVHPMLGWALEAGLVVHPYTLRAEDARRAGSRDGVARSVIDEAVQLYALGAQGLFIDQPDLGVAARARFLASGGVDA
jgi:glycerophosphoryl diester phosphodiesterase